MRTRGRVVDALEKENIMHEAVKLVPVVLFLTASSSLLAKERTVRTEPKPSSQKMVTSANDLDQRVMQLETLVQERSAASTSAGSMSAAEREASDARINALQNSIRHLREEQETAPRYLDQVDPLLP